MDLLATSSAEVTELGDATVLGDSEIGTYLRSWCSAYGLPLIMLDRELRLLWFNGTARDWIAKGAEARNKKGRLVLTDPAAHAEFAEMLDRASAEPLIEIFDRPDGSHMLIRVQKLVPPGRRSLIGMTVQFTDGPQPYIWADIRKVFGLTSAEMRVLGHVLEGKTAEGVAAILGIQVDTIRTHIKRIYAKANVSSCEALFARMLPFRMG